jgi:pyruvoyl-dependent arginine decarboxylase (PvlArgDC)
VDVELCPAGLSHGSIANCVVGAMGATERVAMLRLTAVCAAVTEAADKACAALAK